MSDVAAGSDAALKLQQNMAAAPDVQQAEANKMQMQQLQLQQEAANVERTKLSNLVAETGIEATAQSKQKLQALFQTPEFQKASKEGNYGDLLRMTGATQMQSGDVEGGAKTLSQAETYDAKKLADQQKALEIADREITKANAVIQAVEPQHITETFDSLPPANKNAVYAEVGGQQAWNKFSNEEKKSVLNGLMMAGLRRTAAQTYALDTNKQIIIGDSRKEVARINEDKAIKTKIIGEEGANTREESKESAAFIREKLKEAGKDTRASDRLSERTWSDYNNKINTLMGQSNNAIAKAQKRVDDAQLAATHAPAGSISDEKQAKLNQDVKDAMKARDAIQRDYFQRELNVAESAPDSWKDKQRVIDNLKKQLSLTTPEEPKANKGAPIPAKSIKEEPKKVTSNKMTAEQQSWVDRAKAANPGMSEADIIAEGKKKGKL